MGVGGGSGPGVGVWEGTGGGLRGKGDRWGELDTEGLNCKTQL